MPPKADPDVIAQYTVKKNHLGNTEYCCIHCTKTFSGSATRAQAHILGTPGQGVAKCKACPQPVRDKVALTAQQAESKKRKQSEAGVSTPVASDAKRQRQTTIESGVAKTKNDAADMAIAMFFIQSGVPFNARRSPSFPRMVDAIKAAGPAYQPPSYDRLRGPLLDKAVTQTKSSLEKFNDRLDVTGCSVTSDGWSDTRSRPLQNTMVCASGMAVFHDAADMSGVTKTAANVASKLLESIDEIGAEKVVAVITDSAANCKAAGALIREEHPHIFWAPCAAHCLDLALEDIGGLESHKWVFSQSNDIVNFIRNHQFPLALYNEFSPKLALIKPGATRFATQFLLLDRLLRVRESVERVLVDKRFKAWLKKNKAYKDTVAQIMRVAHSDGYWQRVRDLVDLTEPIVKVLRLADSSAATTGKIYNECCKLQRHVVEWAEDITSIKQHEKSALVEIMKERCNMLHTPLHAAGYLLDPEFWGREVSAMDPKLMDGFREVAAAMLPLVSDQAKVEEELTLFKKQEGRWAGKQLKVSEINAEKMSGATWHETYSSGTLLQKVATRVLSQPTSACACERNWSTYDFIHSKRRNKLHPKRARDLVYVFTNTRIMERVQREGYRQEVVPWQSEWEECSDEEETSEEEGSDSEPPSSDDE